MQKSKKIILGVALIALSLNLLIVQASAVGYIKDAHVHWAVCVDDLNDAKYNDGDIHTVQSVWLMGAQYLKFSYVFSGSSHYSHIKLEAKVNWFQDSYVKVTVEYTDGTKQKVVSSLTTSYKTYTVDINSAKYVKEVTFETTVGSSQSVKTYVDYVQLV